MLNPQNEGCRCFTRRSGDATGRAEGGTGRAEGGTGRAEGGTGRAEGGIVSEGPGSGEASRVFPDRSRRQD
jgi:hypothetical protein